MSSNTEKMFGYALFCVGLICIIFAFYSVYKVFTNVAEPPEIFKTSDLSFLTSFGENQLSTNVTIQLNPEIRKVVNIFLYCLFMFFIVAVGNKIAALGIQFIKEIKVEIRREG